MLESRLIYIRPALFQQEEAFQSIIPVNEDKIAVTKNQLGATLGFFLCVFDLTSIGNPLRHQPPHSLLF